MASATQFLEWHGQQWRVVLKVPVQLRGIIGTTKLKQPLHTADLKVANDMKWDIIARMRDDLKQARDALTNSDPLVAEALRLRIQHRRQDEASIDTIEERADAIFASHGVATAADFLEVATGGSTPLDYHADAFIAYKATYDMGSQKDLRRALKWLGDWRKASHKAPFIEDIDRKSAGRFIDESLAVGRSRTKAAAYLGFLRGYWKWMKQRGHVAENPWVDQDLPNAPRPARNAAPDGDKRPFTDTEIAKLLYGPASPRIADLMHIAALSGMRIEEICQLRVEDCADSLFDIKAGKTAAAKRKVPIHPDLTAIIERRTKGKKPTDFLIDDLPPVPKSRESRSDPASKEFTRYRRKQEVDERPNGKAKSNVDFHSFRRWFIRKARDAMQSGNAGFDEWTFPAVIGHTESERPKSLDLAMIGYAGEDTEKAKRALVESVKLPSKQ